MIERASGNRGVPGDVVGVGSELPERLDGDGFRARHGLDGPFLLYVGRIDLNKGCRQLFDFFLRYRRETGSALRLVLIGRSVLAGSGGPGNRLPRVPARRGEVGRPRRLRPRSSCPRAMESLSMVTLEAWWAERPVLANAKCDVLRGQCQRSNAGLYYASYDEFREALALLERDAPLRRRLGPERPSLLRGELRLGRWSRGRSSTCSAGSAARTGWAPGRRGGVLPRMSRHVHQLLAALSYGDAIGNEALAIQKHLRRAGFASDIFAERVHPRMAHLARPLLRVRGGLLARRRSASSTSRSAARPAGSSTMRPTAWSRSTTTSRRPTSSSASTRTWRASATTAGASSTRSLPAPSWPSATASSTAASSRRRATPGRACFRSSSTSHSTTVRPRR